MRNRGLAVCLIMGSLLAYGVNAHAQVQPGPITAIKAGRLIDPETGTAAANQVIIIEGEKIKAVGAEPRHSRRARRSSICRNSRCCPVWSMRTRTWR